MYMGYSMAKTDMVNIHPTIIMCFSNLQSPEIEEIHIPYAYTQGFGWELDSTH